MRWFQQWDEDSRRVGHSGPAYEALKEAFSARLLGPMLSLFPHLRTKVVFHELGTPLTSKYYLGAAHRESCGLAHTPARYRQGWLQPQTGLPGLYLTGQDVCSAGGKKGTHPTTCPLSLPSFLPSSPSPTPTTPPQPPPPQ